MTEDPNKNEIESAVLEGFVVLDEANRSALITFNPNDPKLEVKRALGLKAALEHRGYTVHAPGLDSLYGRSVSGPN
jgi:hypothetical protein